MKSKIEQHLAAIGATNVQNFEGPGGALDLHDYDGCLRAVRGVPKWTKLWKNPALQPKVNGTLNPYGFGFHLPMPQPKPYSQLMQSAVAQPRRSAAKPPCVKVTGNDAEGQQNLP